MEWKVLRNEGHLEQSRRERCCSLQGGVRSCGEAAEVGRSREDPGWNLG